MRGLPHYLLNDPSSCEMSVECWQLSKTSQMCFNKHHSQLCRHVETLCFWPCISIHSCNHLHMKCTGLQVTLLYCKHMEENMEKTNGQNCIHIFFGTNSKIWSLTFFVQYKLAGLIGSPIDWNFIFTDVSIWVSSSLVIGCFCNVIYL